MRTLGVLLFAWIGLSGIVQGQTSDSTQLQTFTQTAFYKSLVGRIFAGIPKTVFVQCPTLVSNGSRVTPLRPVTFGTDGYPNAGEWVQRFPVSGCGNDTVLNIFFSATPDEKVNTLFGAPGGTHADPVLQRDAYVFANTGAGLVATDCKSFVIKNTKYEDYGIPFSSISDPGPAQKLRPWWETWTMTGCDHTVNVPIGFIPQAIGTQIIQHGGVLVP